MSSKKCFKCGEIKPLSEFYRHKEAADGHLNACKSCKKVAVALNRLRNPEKQRAYDKLRGERSSEEGKAKWREANPRKVKAHQTVAAAISKGVLVKKPCEVCGGSDAVHAHHPDYARPLDVMWLCPVHHKEWHMKHGEGLNA